MTLPLNAPNEVRMPSFPTQIPGGGLSGMPLPTYNQYPVPYNTPNVAQDTGSGRGRLILLVGPPGSGKTTLAAQFTPGQSYWVIDPGETGIYDLSESRQIQVDRSYIRPPTADWNQLLYFNEQILAGTNKPIPQNVRTLIYESVTGFEQQATDTCCRVSYNNNWGEKGFMNFQNGYKTMANEYWVKFLNQLQALREKDYNVILTGHSEVLTEKNASGVDYLVESLRCNRKYTWPLTHAKFENIFFLTYRVEAEKETKSATKGKAKGYTKYLIVNKTPYQDAKNRCGLVDDIEAEGTAQQLYMALCQAARWNPMTLRYNY